MKSIYRHIIILAIIGGFISTALNAQDKVSIKTNILGDATGSIHLGMEFGLATHWSLDITGGYNAWDFKNGRKWRHLLIQPEVRYWFCERNNGHFIGLHAHWMKYNIAKVKMPFNLWKETQTRRYQGDLYGGGLTYGYSWLLGKHWNLEAVIGLGYARVIYDKYPCASCGRILESGTSNYWGPTKAQINLVYVF